MALFMFVILFFTTEGKLYYIEVPEPSTTIEECYLKRGAYLAKEVSFHGRRDATACFAVPAQSLPRCE